MIRNPAKARLRDGGVALGTMVCETWSGEIAYALAAAGFDFFLIDKRAQRGRHGIHPADRPRRTERQYLHPKMKEAYGRVQEVAERHGVAAGLHPDDLAVVQEGRAMGMRCLMCSTEIEILLGAARQAVQALRGERR